MIRMTISAFAAAAVLAGCSTGTQGQGGNPLIDAIKREPVPMLLAARNLARDLDSVCDQVRVALLVAPEINNLRQDRGEEVDNATSGAISRAERSLAAAIQSANGLTTDLAGTPKDQWDTATVCPAAVREAGTQSLVGVMLDAT